MFTFFQAVQRHRATILECLKDPDVSIKRRAMELSFALMNPQNFKIMAKELIAFLQTAEPVFKSECSSGMLTATDRHAPGPGKRCQIDTLLDVLKAAGNYVRDDVIFNTIQLVSETTDLQPYVVHEAWKAIRDTENCTEKQPLTQVACWCIGEYGASLLDGVSIEGETLTVTEDEVIEVYQKIVWAKHMSLVTKQYAIMSVTKLSTRFPTSTPKIQEIIDAFGCHLEIDLQQRGVEFSQLFRKHDGMRSALLEPMPPMERDTSMSGNANDNNSAVNVNGASQQEESNLLGNDLADLNLGLSIIGSTAGSGGTPGAANEMSLLDLIDSSGGGGAPNPASTTSSFNNAANNNKGQDSLLDLLGDLDMSGTPSITTNGGDNNPTNVKNMSNLLDGLSATTTTTSTVPASSNSLVDDIFNNVNNSNSSSIPNLIGYHKNGVKINFSFDRPTPEGRIVMHLNIVNEDMSTPASEFSLQAAVPKSMKLDLSPPSGTTLAANGGAITQMLEVKNPNKAVLKMRLKVSFSRGGLPVQDQAEVSNFPPALTASL